MRHLALIVSARLDTLTSTQAAAHKAGFNVNCISDIPTAQTLIARYADDFHVVIVDAADMGKDLKRFIQGVRANAPKSRVVVALAEGQTFESDDPFITVADHGHAQKLLPRLKREVTRYRSNPVNKAEAG